MDFDSTCTHTDYTVGTKDGRHWCICRDCGKYVKEITLAQAMADAKPKALIYDLKKAAETIQATAAIIKTDTNTIKADTATVKTNTTSIKTDTTAIKTSTNTIASDIAGIKTGVTRLESLLEEMITVLNEIATNTDTTP